jgi:hypothetical protein
MQQQSPPLGYLMEPMLIIEWMAVEQGIVNLLNEHDFETNDEEDHDFSNEFDFIESKVPAGPEGRSHINFTRVIVTAVMKYAVGRKLLFFQFSEFRYQFILFLKTF